jgi:SAM-dependent methyltransferase
MLDASQRHLLGATLPADRNDFGDGIALDDHKIAFALAHCRGRSVLDVGCVQHNPENYRSRFWLHKAIRTVASELVGLDYYREGVDYLRQRGYDVVFGDAQDFDLERRFDVVVAADIIEHLEQLASFLECCKRHLNDDGVLLLTTPNPWFWRLTVKAALRDEVRANPEHTCWFCPQTLRQLVERHDMTLERVTYGSRQLLDRLMPLPRRWRCSSFHAVVRKGGPRHAEPAPAGGR